MHVMRETLYNRLVACPALPLSSSNEISFDAPAFDDVFSDAYRTAVRSALDIYRWTRYAHLSELQYQKLRARVRAWAPYLHIDGAPSSTLKGLVFDVEFVPNAVPVKRNLPKYSED